MRYTRRTFDEATELAREAFRAQVAAQLSDAEVQAIGTDAVLTGGTVKAGWESHVGFVPNDSDFYELEIYKPAEAKPYIEVSYARMLVPRDRASSVVHFIWRSRADAAQRSLEKR
uniref:DUF440 family protein n=1 Tax=unclassified Variovorax TaxID=663243 RepID=UPI000D3A489B